MGKKGAAEAEAPASAENIKVIVRCRPLNSKETEAGYKPCVDLNLSEATIQVNHVCGAPDRWTFDAVVNNTFTQKDVFTQFIMPLVDSVLDGFNATVFAYGQSGSGKTHTMTGKYDDAELMGIIPRSFRYVFEHIRRQQEVNPGRVYALYCSYIELYNGKVRDLLAKVQVTLNVKENKDKTFYVQGAHIPQVKFPEDLIRLMEEGTDRRQVAATELNADSSRSHSIFTLMVECTETGDDGDTRSVTSKFNLVDLAGSERQSKTGASGDTLKEGCNINLSLSALGTVIDTIVKGKGHVPFRSSPLTMLLKDSLGGSSKTVMFANIGPSEHNLSETVSTLRFADRAKQIKNKPIVNMDSKDQKIVELTELVNQLKEKLKVLETGNMEELEQEVATLTEKCSQLEIDLDNAVKGREADGMEATATRDALRLELTELTTARDEAIARIEALQQELIVAEQCSADERIQRSEIWSVCSSELHVDVADVDSLRTLLHALDGRVDPEEHAKIVAELNCLTAELRSVKDVHEADLAHLRASEAEAREEADQLSKKLEKAKEKLEKEKANRRQLVEAQEQAAAASSSPTHDSPTRGDMSSVVDGGASAEKVAELESFIAQLQSRLEGSSNEQELTAPRAQVADQAKTIAQLLAKLEHQAPPADVEAMAGESKAVANLMTLVANKDEAIRHARQEIDRLEAQVELLQAPQLKRATSQSALQEHHHAASRDELRSELRSTTDHRDQLIRDFVLADGPDSRTDDEKVKALTEQVERLVEENANLRHQQQKEAVLAGGRRGSMRGAEASADQVAEAHRQLEEAKQEFAAKEAQWAAALAGGSSFDVVESLMKDKAQMESSLKQAESELHATKDAHAKAVKELAEARSNATRLKQSLTQLDPSALEEASSAAAIDAAASSDVTQSQSSAQVAAAAQRVALLEDEKAEAVAELEAIKVELEEEKGRRDAARRELAAAHDEMAHRSHELAASEMALVEERNLVATLRAELAKAVKDSEASQSAIASLEGRVKERSEQSAELRRLMESQKGVLDSTKAKVENLNQQLVGAKEEAIERERQHQRAMQEAEAAAQRSLNRRIEALSEEHHKALHKKDEEIAAMRKKLKKSEKQLAEMQQLCDEKIAECAELESHMEERAFEAMRARKDVDQLALEDGQDAVGDALQRVKEVNRKKLDKFANGDISSAVSGIRGVAGSAAAAAKARSAKPPTPPSEDLGAPPPRRASPRPQYAAVGAAVGTGGAGYSSMAFRPSTAAGATTAFAAAPPAAVVDSMYDF